MRKFGDRTDAKRIYPKDPVHILMPYLMSKRHEAEVYINQKIDVTELLKWVADKNKNLDYKLTFFHAMVAITAKTIYSRPLLNRFIKGKNFYERNDVSVSFVAKDKLSDDAEEKLMVFTMDENELPVDLSKRILDELHKSKHSNNSNGGSDVYKTLTKLPSFMLSIIFAIGKWLDKIGFLPSSLMENDFNFSTVLLSNLGSIKCGAVYHHLNEYGTNSIVITIGTIHNENGRDVVEIGGTLDERIADGFYFAKSLKYVQHIASHPELLDEEVGKVVDNIDF
ncbi:MAG: hypothetical protein MJ224_03825 [archaeon]|nr:hypothetical protein [archaeon]